MQVLDAAGASPLELANYDIRFQNTLRAAAAGDMDIDDIL